MLLLYSLISPTIFTIPLSVVWISIVDTLFPVSCSITCMLTKGELPCAFLSPSPSWYSSQWEGAYTLFLLVYSSCVSDTMDYRRIGWLH